MAAAVTLAFFGAWCHYPPAFAEEVTLPKIESGKVVLTWAELKLLLEELEELKRAKALEEEAEKKAEEKKEELPPAEYSIAEAEYKGTVRGETARFEADFSVLVLKKGWVTIPFFPNDVGIETLNTASAENPPETVSHAWENRDSAQFVRGADGYSLIAKGPGSFSIQAIFHIPVRIENLVRTLSFLPPRAVINRMMIQFSDKGVYLTQTSPAGRLTRKEDATAFEAVLSERDTLKLSWKIEKDAGITRKKQAVLHSLVSVDKSAVSVFARVLLRHVASLDQTGFHLPPNAEIINVTSPVIEKWHVEHTEKSQIVRLTGQTDRHTAAEISLSYRIRLPSLPAKVDVPMLEVRDVDTLEGFAGVEIIGNLEVMSQGVSKGIRIPAKNLPKALWNSASSPLLYGYEFHVNGFSPMLNIRSYSEIQTVMANVDIVDCVTHRTLAGKSVTRIRYFIRNNDRQFLTLTLPEKSRIWQAFLDGKPVKPARKETGEILIPMKKSPSRGEELSSFLIEIGYISDVSKLTLKGDIINRLPEIDIPVNYLRWRLYLPEYYGYTKFEGPMKQVSQFSNVADSQNSRFGKPLIDIPTRGQQFLFEKFLIVDETPYIRGKYGQYLGDDIFLSLQPQPQQFQFKPQTEQRSNKNKSDMLRQQQVIPNWYK